MCVAIAIWHLQNIIYYHSMNRINFSIHCFQVSVLILSNTIQLPSQHEKFRKAVVLTSELASVVISEWRISGEEVGLMEIDDGTA